MTTKQYLEQIERLDRMIQNKLQEIYQLRIMVCGTTSVNNGDKVQASYNNDKLGIMVAKIIDMEEEVNDMIDKRYNIVNQIEKMDNTTYYHILFSRYVLKNKFEKISKEISFSYRQTTREHKKALEEFEKIYGNIYTDSITI